MSNEGIVMSERDNFEAWHKKKYRGLNYKVMPNGQYLHERVNLDYQIWLAALEHCKQGEPRAWSYSQRHADGHISSHLSSNEPNKQLIEYGNIFEVEQLFLHTVQPDISPQPPADNDHVADGCELFAHAMPKSDESVITKLRDLYLRKLCTSETIYEKTTIPIDELRKILDSADATPQPTTDISELIAALNALANDIAANDDEGLCEHAESMINARAIIAKHTVK